MNDEGQPYAVNVNLFTFVGALCFEARELRPILHSHLEDNFWGLLPYVFMAEVAFFVTDDNPDEHTLRSIFSFLERALESDESIVDELICVSFVENLAAMAYFDNHPKELAGPKLAKAYNVCASFKGHSTF
jgi:hypothetical protein